MLSFTCDRTQLLAAINIVSKAVSTRTTLPILECILIKTYENGFKLTGNDLEMGIETALIDAKVEGQGEIALDAKLFGDIVRRVNGDEISLVAGEKNAITLTSGTSQFQLMGQDGSEFPSLPQVEQVSYVSVKEQDFKALITETIFSVSMDESKPVLNGELMEIQNG